jgi:hypothetical protein
MMVQTSAPAGQIQICGSMRPPVLNWRPRARGSGLRESACGILEAVLEEACWRNGDVGTACATWREEVAEAQRNIAKLKTRAGEGL